MIFSDQSTDELSRYLSVAWCAVFGCLARIFTEELFLDATATGKGHGGAYACGAVTKCTCFVLAPELITKRCLTIPNRHTSRVWFLQQCNWHLHPRLYGSVAFD
jgi:hypothetical protein